VKISELLEKRSPPTITSASRGSKGLDQKLVNPMVDPRGYFADNKRRSKQKKS
jgi:hypothetical protein